MKNERIKILLSNKQNTRFFEYIDSYEAGLLLNSEIRSKILNYKVSLNGCYGWIKKDEIWLRGWKNQEIKLLLNKYEIDRIIKNVKEKGYLIIPENIYLKNYKIKMNLLICKKQRYTNKKKLETIKRKDEKKLSEYY